jgi:hypothetical protein
MNVENLDPPPPKKNDRNINTADSTAQQYPQRRNIPSKQDESSRENTNSPFQKPNRGSNEVIDKSRLTNSFQNVTNQQMAIFDPNYNNFV